MSSDSSASSPAPSPTDDFGATYDVSSLSISDVPETPMEEVRRFFRSKSHTEILQYGLGMDAAGAPELAANTIVVTMDCEKIESESRVLTEYGLNTFSRKDMVPVLKEPGVYGEEMLRNIYYYHIRLREHAHYINRRFCPGNPEKNHFGTTRFATKQQARDFLSDCLSWPIDENDSEGAKCPVIFLGHSVKNELQMLQEELDVDPAVSSNVVAIIDTQKIADEQGIRGRGDRIGLAALIQNFNVAFRDGHTAGNDAAYTIISAVQMAMKMQQKDPQRSLQAVVDAVSEYSREVVPAVGTAKYCTRCARFDHNQPQCRGGIKRCETCLASGHERAAYTHITKLCTHCAVRS